MHVVLSKERKERGLTQEEFAKYLGVKKDYYARREREEQQFTLDEAIKIAEILGISLFTLFPKIFRLKCDKNTHNKEVN